MRAFKPTVEGLEKKELLSISHLSGGFYKQDLLGDNYVLVGTKDGVTVNIPAPYTTIETCRLIVPQGIASTFFTYKTGSYKQTLDSNGNLVLDKLPGDLVGKLQTHFDFLFGTKTGRFDVTVNTVASVRNADGTVQRRQFNDTIPMIGESPKVNFYVKGSPISPAFSVSSVQYYATVQNTTHYPLSVAMTNLESGSWSTRFTNDSLSWYKTPGYMNSSFNVNTASIPLGATVNYSGSLGSFAYANPNPGLTFKNRNWFLSFKTSLVMNDIALSTANWHIYDHYDVTQGETRDIGTGLSPVAPYHNTTGWISQGSNTFSIPTWLDTIHGHNYPNTP